MSIPENRIVRGLSMVEFKMILEAIHRKHRLIEGKCVKYVDFSFDFRTLEVWRVSVRPFLTVPKEFSTANRFDDGKHDNLFDEIMDWLSTTEETGG